jgi:hypothetical protein
MHVNADGTTSVSMGLRLNDEWYKRVIAVARASRRRPGAVIKICVEDHLPTLEKTLGIKPGQDAKKLSPI